MNGPSNLYDSEVVVLGAGPAGLAAAVAAARCGARVLLVEMMGAPGGRVWAGGVAQAGRDRRVRELLDLEVRLLPQARVVGAWPGRLLVEQQCGQATQTLMLRFQRLVLATGARELQLPFPGWTLPGVVAAGGLQLMAKSGLALAGRRVVVAGSGPLLLAAAATARATGALVLHIAEQAPARRVLRFALQLLHTPDRAWQAVRMRLQLAGIPYRLGQRLQEAEAGPDGWVRAVRLQDAAGREQRLPCDLLAVSHGLVPELDLAASIGCALHTDPAQPTGVRVDAVGQTTVPGVYAAGEITGVGGLRKALADGKTAGAAAAGQPPASARWRRERQRELAYVRRLHAAFAPRCDEAPEPTPDTLVCRCEDVRWSELAVSSNWREARLQQRCGMGHCQGRLCGAALAVLEGWQRSDARMPLLPARVATLAGVPD
jgi:NADPH-dependent 2,4-dienoyl-CoA reductase/sulfur reductase-like enzyme